MPMNIHPLSNNSPPPTATKPLFPHLNVFPIEIKLEVLRHVLICTDRLAFTHLPLTSAEEVAVVNKWPLTPYWRKRFSDTLRLARLNHCEHGEPAAKALQSDFNALCLVSKDMRRITRTIFFMENSWVLHTSGSFDAITWIAKTWGTEALSLMRDVRLEIQGMGQVDIHSKRLENEYRAIEIFAQAAKEGKTLSNLSVQWIERSPPMGCATGPGRSWHFHPLLRDHGLERNRERGRGLIITSEEAVDLDEDNYGTKYLGPESEEESWREKEVVLLPLVELRGPPKVRIEGTVTEAWATWLETSMTASDGEVTPHFEFQPEVKTVVQEPKGRRGTR
jgi:hypothetical protein